MSMSTDRVHFNLPAIGESAAITAAIRAFGMTSLQARTAALNKTTIICRPSQFARWMIYRNDLGARNSFIELNAKLVEVSPIADIIDVSRTPR